MEIADMTLYNDDCMNIFKKLSDNSIDLIVTDPPYKMTSKGCHGNTGGMLRNKLVMKGDVFQFNNIDCLEYAPQFYRVLKDGSHCYVMCNQINLIHMLNVFTDAGFTFIKSLIWVKDNKIMGRMYMSQYEYILFFRKGKSVQINDCSTSDVLPVHHRKLKESGKNLHDTEKPVELMSILVRNSSKQNDVVLDPFMGIGSTGLACKENNRKFIGIELDENYYNVAKKRISDKQNIKPLF